MSGLPNFILLLFSLNIERFAFGMRL